MKLLCLSIRFVEETKMFEYRFISIGKTEYWITGEFWVTSDKPTAFTVGETYESTISVG